MRPGLSYITQSTCSPQHAPHKCVNVHPGIARTQALFISV